MISLYYAINLIVNFLLLFTIVKCILHKNIIESLLFSIVANTLSMYLSLCLATPLLLSPLTLSLGWFIYTQRSRLKLKGETDSFIISTFLIFIFLFVITIPRNFKFMAWDEFSCWAYKSKWMFTNLRIWEQGEIQYFAEYPPILHILHLQAGIFTNFQFNEFIVVSSQIILFFILLADLWIAPTKVSKISSVIGFFVSLSCIYAFGFTLMTVVPDLLLGTLFANVLLRVALCKHTKYEYLQICSLLSFISLLKPTGIVFTIIVLGFFILKHGLRIRNFYLLILIPAFLFTSSWQIMIYMNKLNPDSYTVFGIFKKIIDRFSHSSESADVASGLDARSYNYARVAFKMFTDFFSGDIRFGTPFLILLILGLLAVRPHRRTILYFAITFVFYESIIFLTYIFLMSDFEAENTASHARYSATFLMPFAWLLLRKWAETVRPASLSVFMVLVSMIMSFLGSNFFNEFQNRQPYKDNVQSRENAVKAVSGLDYLPKDKFLFVDQNSLSLGYSRLIFSYQIAPNLVEMSCWSFGKPYFDGDIWTCNVPMSEILLGIDYVIVQFADSVFYEKLSTDGIAYDKEMSQGIFKVKILGKTIELYSVGE